MSRFHIGARLWPGISKLVEEAGEVVQVGGKLIGSQGDVNHFDGTDLKDRLEEELADMVAAIRFVVERNGLDAVRIERRIAAKKALFDQWHETQRTLEDAA